MARKNKKKNPSGLAGEIRELIYSPHVPGETKLMIGIGAALFGYMTIQFAPKFARRVIPELLSAFEPPVAVHPEAAEPITTMIDERQLGRSEVIREISKGRGN